MIFTWAVEVAPALSVTVSWNIYWPAISADTVGVELFALLILAVEGPDVCVQLNLTIVPSGSEELEPFSETELTGRVMVLLEPASATGGKLSAAFTVTLTVSVSVAPPLSV